MNEISFPAKKKSPSGLMNPYGGNMFIPRRSVSGLFLVVDWAAPHDKTYHNACGFILSFGLSLPLHMLCSAFFGLALLA